MADDIAPLASLSLTHVYYDPSDPISFICAFLALVPQALCVVYVTLIWSTREAEVVLMFAGQLGCEAVNFALKRIIKEDRPPFMAPRGKGYGMPSSHAQFAFFWAVAAGLFLVMRHKPRGSDARKVWSGPVAGAGANKGRATRSGGGGFRQIQMQDVEKYAHQPWSLLERVFVTLLALGVASAVAASRIYLGYHTPQQVLAGCLAGSVCAVLWFGATYVLRQSGLLALALDFPIVRWFRIRDLVVEEDMCQAGWEKWEDQRLAAERLKKK